MVLDTLLTCTKYLATNPLPKIKITLKILQVILPAMLFISFVPRLCVRQDMCLYFYRTPLLLVAWASYTQWVHMFQTLSYVINNIKLYFAYVLLLHTVHFSLCNTFMIISPCMGSIGWLFLENHYGLQLENGLRMVVEAWGWQPGWEVTAVIQGTGNELVAVLPHAGEKWSCGYKSGTEGQTGAIFPSDLMGFGAGYGGWGQGGHLISLLFSISRRLGEGQERLSPSHSGTGDSSFFSLCLFHILPSPLPPLTLSPISLSKPLRE